jgi:O-antigen/teichoic acid export membrane protein
MLGYGAWLTVSNVVGPLMVYADRFVIGALLPVASVAYYSAPHEALTRLWILPAALTSALFPSFAAAAVAEARLLYRKGVLAMLVTAVPLALVAGLLASQWMTLWLGADFASRGAPAARWLAFGVAVNCLAYIPFTLLQARGRADLTGKLHLAELPVYLAALTALVGSSGIEGAAIAWAGRCAFDAVALFVLAGRHLGGGRA